MSDSSPPSPRHRDSEPPAVTLADLDEARALYDQLDPALFEPENDPEAWLFEPAVQELIARLVDEQIAAWTSPHRPEDRRVLREELTLAYHTDRKLIDYLRRIRPRAAQERSGAVLKNAVVSAKILALPRKKAGGGEP